MKKNPELDYDIAPDSLTIHLFSTHLSFNKLFSVSEVFVIHRKHELTIKTLGHERD